MQAPPSRVGVGGDAQALVEERQQLLSVREVVLVWAVLVTQDLLAVDANVEEAVAAWHEPDRGEVLAQPGEELAGEPHGPQCMPSGVAVLDLDLHVFSSHYRNRSFSGARRRDALPSGPVS